MNGAGMLISKRESKDVNFIGYINTMQGKNFKFWKMYYLRMGNAKMR